ncbi:MAG TPA: hypothetical protein PK752_20385, partial [Accumulibacter sp.]|uniref:cation transporting ATPase C-terminal domain-containing protein n=1 Tax=Accumulibacter sp. TaxID=2053492 RepID=UPI002C5288A6
QVMAVYLPAAQPFFHTVALGGVTIGIGIGLALSVLLAMELEKWLRARAGWALASGVAAPTSKA